MDIPPQNHNVSTDATGPLPRLDALQQEVTENIARFLPAAYEDKNKGLDDFRALRLTCKDLYLKTFRLYGVTYLSDVSVVLTKHSLERLRNVATCKNGFGLSLSSFPKSITCSTYRLPSGERVEALLMPEQDLSKDHRTQRAIHAIGFACRAPSGRYLPGLDLNDSHVTNIVDAYVEAVTEQRSMDGNGHDVRSLAETMVLLPNLEGVGCDVNCKAWGQIDWSARADIRSESFSCMDHAVSGKSNLTTTAEKVLRAIGQASVICQYEKRHIRLKHLSFIGELGSSSADAELIIQCIHPQNVALHRIDISGLEHPLRDALSQLISIELEVDPGERAVSIDTTKAQIVLKILFFNHATSRVCLTLEDEINSDELEDDGSYLGLVLETQHWTRLRTLKLPGPNLYLRLPEITGLIGEHATSLEELCVDSCMRDTDTDLELEATECRNEWRPILQVASRCEKLEHLKLNISADDIAYDVVIDLTGREAVKSWSRKIADRTGLNEELDWI
jgi:hypothetical protein